jgi:hypothetical protein
MGGVLAEWRWHGFARVRPLRERWGRPTAVGLSVLFALIGLLVFLAALAGTGQRIVGLDVGHYLDATRRWLETGTPYLPSEVAGPYEIGPLTFLHPPIALLLFAPFLVLPTFLWWIIPLAVVGWCVVAWRPADWTWPLMVALLALTRFHIPLIVGNSDLWVWAGVAAGLRYAWPALLIAIKPSLFFFMFIGSRHRSWWIAAVVVGLLCIPFGSLWLDWVAVVRNAPKDLSYSLLDVPWLIVPIIAWAARTRPAPVDYPRLLRRLTGKVQPT